MEHRRLSAIPEIERRLAKYPNVRYEADESQITIRAQGPEGFDVSLEVASDGYRVSFEGWHEEFSSEAEALNCLAFGLSTACRLRTDYRGDFPYRWTVEGLDNGSWQADSTTGLVLFPFWRRRRVAYRQNAVIKDAGDSAA